MIYRLLLATALVLLLITSGSAGPDKVAFPADYKTQHLLYTTVDRHDQKTVREFYASRETVQRAKAGQPLPSGTVLTMEIHKAKLDDKGEPVRDAKGYLVKDGLTAVFVMEKRTGWGTEYSADLRNGEWEYARFTSEGKPPAQVDTIPCFQCHKPKSGQDFVFTLPQLTTAP